MDKIHYRKFLMAKIDVAQREIEVTKELVSMLDGETHTEAPEKVETKVEPKKEKPTKKAPKAEVEAAPEVEQEQESAPEASSDDDFFGEDDDLKTPTVDDVRKVVKAFAAKHGKQKTEKLLSKFGAQAIPQIKEKDFAKVIELANKYL